MQNYNEKIGIKIKQMRKAKGLTQAELAEKIGRSKNHLSKIEIGTANPPLSLILEIADALEIHPSVLFDFGDISESDSDIQIKLNNIKSPKQRKLILSTLSTLLNNL